MHAAHSHGRVMFWTSLFLSSEEDTQHAHVAHSVGTGVVRASNFMPETDRDWDLYSISRSVYVHSNRPSLLTQLTDT